MTKDFAAAFRVSPGNKFNLAGRDPGDVSQSRRR